MIGPVLLGAAALWVFYRKRHGLPLVPHLFGSVPHIEVITPGGPALIPASTTVIPVAAVSPTLAMAAAATSVDTGIHAPRYIQADPGIHAPRYIQAASGQFVGQGTAEHHMFAQHAQHAQQNPLAFDILSHQSMPRGLHYDELGVLRSSLSRPFGAR